MRKDVEGQGVHTGAILLEEIQLGDSIVFPTKGESKKEKRIFTIGWEPLVTLNQEAADIELINEYPKSIFNSRGSSPNGTYPEKMSEWEIGFGVVIQTPLTMPYEERVVVLCRASKNEYVLFRSRETRHSDRFT